jgi:hypothetical protein
VEVAQLAFSQIIASVSPKGLSNLAATGHQSRFSFNTLPDYGLVACFDPTDLGRAPAKLESVAEMGTKKNPTRSRVSIAPPRLELGLS